jgi:hypothetical protein
MEAMPQKFTLQEASALLPRLSDILVEMQETKTALDALRAELGDLTRTAGGNGHLVEAKVSPKRRQAQTMADRLNALLEEVNAMGCELKGIDEGLIDFPADRDGRVVYLCWKLGEEQIAFWHELDTGFAGRRPL